MIRSFVTWIKTHKITTLLLVVIAYFLLRDQAAPVFLSKNSYDMGSYRSVELGSPASSANFGLSQKIFPGSMPPSESAPVTDVTNRMVVQNSHLSLFVKNV